MVPRLTFLLGKPPKPGTLLAEVSGDLTDRGLPVTLRLPHDQALETARVLYGHLLVAAHIREHASAG